MKCPICNEINEVCKLVSNPACVIYRDQHGERPSPEGLAASTCWETCEPEALAQRFHETYERLAPSFGYETRKASAVAWNEVPENNRKLMIAVCAELLSPNSD